MVLPRHNWVFRDESMHINFALAVIDTVRAESPELFDAEFEKQIGASTGLPVRNFCRRQDRKK
jgi:hypothetical protein